jgi:hypothetical protein
MEVVQTNQNMEVLPTCQEKKPIQEQSIESQPLSQNIEEVELFTNSLEITKTSTNVIDDSFKKKIYMHICTYKQSYNYLQKINNFSFFPKNRKILSEINLQKLENFNNPYNDKIKNLDNIDFTKFSAMMTLLCVRLAKDVHTSRSVSIFYWVQRKKFSEYQSSVYFVPDKTTLNCKWNGFNGNDDNFKIKLKTCKGSILKKTTFMITIPKLYKYINIQVNPFEINPVIIFNDKNGKDIVFEVTHTGFTPVSKKIIQYDYIHPTLFVRATIFSGKIHKKCGRNMMHDSKISLFDKDLKNFITYYLDDGRVSYEYYCNYDRYKKRKYITEKSRESWENCSFGTMLFSITEPVFAVTINNEILFINYETHQVIIRTVGKNIIFHPRLPLFWSTLSVANNIQKRILCLRLINTSFTQAIPIAYSVIDPVEYFDAM